MMWKLNPDETIFNGKTEFVETINGNLLRRIIDSDFNMDYMKEISDPNKIQYYQNLKQHLQEVCRRLKNDTLSLYPCVKKGSIGRAYYPKSVSLSQLPYRVRHTLCKDNYVDFDMKVAHQSILIQVCNFHDIPEEEYKQTSMYVSNREDELERLSMKYFNKNKSHSDYDEYRCKIKTLFTRTFYLGGFRGWCIDNALDPEEHEEDIQLILIKQELRHIVKRYIILNNKELFDNIKKNIDEKKKKEPNYNKDPIATICSMFLQNMERIIIEKIINQLIKDKLINYSDIVYCYDGLMIKKTSPLMKDNTISQICSLFKTIIYSEMDFNIEWDDKPMNADIFQELDEYDRNFNPIMDKFYLDEITFDNDLLNEYNTMLDDENADKKKLKKLEKELNMNIMDKKTEYFEKYHFKMCDKMMYCRLCNNQIYFLSKKSLKELYENQQVFQYKKGEVETKQFIDLWLKRTNIKEYQNYDFLPYPLYCPSYTYNSFRDFPIKSVKITQKYDTSILYKHLFHLCNRDEQCKEYVLNYLAHMFQYPGLLPRVSLVFISSAEGVGKNLFFETMCKTMIGEEYYLQTADPDNVLGRFSLNYQNFMVMMDEASGRDTFVNNEKIKNLITADNLVLERKGIDGFPVRNVGRYIFFSNNSTPLKIPVEDRRFMVCESYMPCEKSDKNEYFTLLHKTLTDKNIMRTFYDELMGRDLTHVSLELDRPITIKYRDLQSVNVPPEYRWLENLYYTSLEEINTNKEIIKNCRNDMELSRLQNENKELELQYNTVMDFYKMYKKYCEKAGMKTESINSVSSFGRKLRAITHLPDSGISFKKSTNGIRKYVIDIHKVYEYMKQHKLLEDYDDDF